MYTKKELLNKNKGEVKIDYKELTGEMPIMLKISLYQNFKKNPTYLVGRSKMYAT